MRTLYCSTCSQSFDADEEGMAGEFGIIPVAFCGTCRVGIHDLAQIEWDLVPREEPEPEPEPCKHKQPYFSEEKDALVCLDCGKVCR